MKKIIVSFLAGALMMVSVQAFGSSVSQIGKKIQTEYTVTIDGKKLTVPAIAVDGQSFAPVRAFGNAAGYEVSVNGKDIFLNKGDDSKVVSQEQTVTPSKEPAATLTDNQNKLATISAKIIISGSDIGFTEAQLKDDPNNTELKAKLEKLKSEYADLLAQKAAIEQEELNN
ncbi:hypothetical protein NST48_14340 [Paenibacillus sp. FSL M7-0547]|uniref:hypothetical protein n=1 Tax=Paenibacillus sp. FSL M7-0547 TaxID=2954755 RepID=UPI0030FCD7F2